MSALCYSEAECEAKLHAAALKVSGGVIYGSKAKKHPVDDTAARRWNPCKAKPSAVTAEATQLKVDWVRKSVKTVAVVAQRGCVSFDPQPCVGPPPPLFFSAPHMFQLAPCHVFSGPVPSSSRPLWVLVHPPLFFSAPHMFQLAPCHVFSGPVPSSSAPSGYSRLDQTCFICPFPLRAPICLHAQSKTTFMVERRSMPIALIWVKAFCFQVWLKEFENRKSMPKTSQTALPEFGWRLFFKVWRPQCKLFHPSRDCVFC